MGLGLTIGGVLVRKYADIKLGLFMGTLLGLEDVRNQVGSFIGGRVMGLTVGGLLIMEYVGIKLSSFVATLLGLEDVRIKLAEHH